MKSTTIIEAHSFDAQTLSDTSELRGRVHSVYENAISLEVANNLVTLTTLNRGIGPGFILFDPKIYYEKLKNIMPGTDVVMETSSLSLRIGHILIYLKDAKKFNSALTFSPGTLNDLQTLKKNIVSIFDFFVDNKNLAISFLSIASKRHSTQQKCYACDHTRGSHPEVHNNSSPTISSVFPSSILLAWRETADKILLSLQESIEKRNEIGFCDSISRLIGFGYGLTPGGDDFILGLLGAIHYCHSEQSENFPQNYLTREKKLTKRTTAKPTLLKSNDANSESSLLREETIKFIRINLESCLPRLLKKTNFISASYLKYALERRYVGIFKEFLDVLLKSNVKENKQVLEEIKKYGSTSGMDTVAGAVFAIANI